MCRGWRGRCLGLVIMVATVLAGGCSGTSNGAGQHPGSGGQAATATTWPPWYSRAAAVGQRQRKTRKLVAGPDVYICEQCVEMAETVIRSGQATETALGPLHSVPDNMAQRRCSFCGKRRHQVTGLATSVGAPAGKLADDAAICSECLVLCREIHSEQLA